MNNIIRPIGSSNKMNKDKLIYSNKALLNNIGEHGVAALSVNINHEDERYAGSWPAINGSFSISDCNRTIHLDVNVYNPEDFDNTLYKLSTLAKIANEAYQALLPLKDNYNKKYIKAKKIEDKKEKERKRLAKKAKKEAKLAKKNKKADKLVKVNKEQTSTVLNTIKEAVENVNN